MASQETWYDAFAQSVADFVKSQGGMYDLTSFCKDFSGERPRKLASIADAVKKYGEPFGVRIITHSVWGDCLEYSLPNNGHAKVDVAFPDSVSSIAGSSIMTPDEAWLVAFARASAEFVKSNGGTYDLTSFCKDFTGERPKKLRSIEGAINAYGDQFGLRLTTHSEWGQCLEYFASGDAKRPKK
jgi:hypothetical protein